MSTVLNTAALPLAIKRYADGFRSSLKKFFPDDPLMTLGSDMVAWPVEELNDTIDDVYITAGGDPMEISAEAVKLGSARLPGLAYRVWLTERELMWEADPSMVGNPLVSQFAEMASRKVNKEILAKVRRIELQKEHERAMALAGTLSYNIGAAAMSVSMGLETSPDQTPTAAVSWATVTTDIIGDILAWSKTLENLCGAPAAYMLVNSKTFGYLANNTALAGYVQAGIMAGSGAGGAATRDGLVLPMCNGIILQTVDSSYVKAGTRTDYVPDDKVIMLPDPAIVTPGSEIIGPAMGEMVNANGDVVGGINWGLVSKVSQWPDGKMSVDVKKASLNVLTRPRAVMYGDATP